MSTNDLFSEEARQERLARRAKWNAWAIHHQPLLEAVSDYVEVHHLPPQAWRKDPLDCLKRGEHERRRMADLLQRIEDEHGFTAGTAARFVLNLAMDARSNTVSRGLPQADSFVFIDEPVHATRFKASKTFFTKDGPITISS